MSKSQLRRVTILDGKGRWHVSCPNHHISRLDEMLKKSGQSLNPGKIGEGSLAPIFWYREGKIHKVINYCIDDVALERDLGKFIDRFGYVINGRGQIIRLDRGGQSALL